MRPRIVIPTNQKLAEGASPAQAVLNEHYVRLVFGAGGLPVLAPPLGALGDDLARAYQPDGVLLSGGLDLAPALYGHEAHPQTRPLPPARQAAELAWFRWADDAGVPVLGICLGCQVINVARGGTLAQYLPDRPQTQPHHLPDCHRRHDVQIVGPMLRGIVGVDTVAVNSRHQQAVDQTGRGLRVAAVSADGVVEAVEDTEGGFVLGLQWHPEYFPHEDSTQAIMAAFLAVAARGRSVTDA